MRTPGFLLVLKNHGGVADVHCISAWIAAVLPLTGNVRCNSSSPIVRNGGQFTAIAVNVVPILCENPDFIRFRQIEVLYRVGIIHTSS